MSILQAVFYYFNNCECVMSFLLDCVEEFTVRHCLIIMFFSIDSETIAILWSLSFLMKSGIFVRRSFD